ncbi:MAG TPA: glycosyltransferase [Actinomycetota bacterium]
MRILLWHGWLLEGSGSNVAAARLAEVYRASGHDVLLVCQEGHPERYPWIDASGTVDASGVPEPAPNPHATPASGRCVLLRPLTGRLLPVFVVDEYEGFEVKAFVDLTDEELEAYLGRCVEALAAAAAWHRPEAVLAAHAVPGPAIARRALGPRTYLARIHGSDLEYAVRPQRRYRELAAEGLGAARAVTGATHEVLARCVQMVPAARDLTRVIRPGVSVEAFHPMPRREALLDVAERLEADPDIRRGRPSSHDALVARAVANGTPDELDRLATTYDQDVPDPDAAGRLRELARSDRPLVGYLGKLIPQKGVELLIAGACAAETDVDVAIVGFGTHRERLEAFAMEAERGRRIVFTGRLDHRYAPGVLAAMDVAVVPSILEEAFGMVAAEAAAAGALPLVARHSGLAEVAAELEAEVGRPGLFSFEPGPEGALAVADGIDRLLGLPADERDDLRARVSAFVAREWTWERTAASLLEAATGPIRKA